MSRPTQRGAGRAKVTPMRPSSSSKSDEKLVTPRSKKKRLETSLLARLMHPLQGIEEPATGADDLRQDLNLLTTGNAFAR